MSTKEAVIDFSGMASQAEIAAALGLSPGRVSQVVSEIKEDLGIAPKASLLSQQLADKADGLELKIIEAFESKLPLFAISAKPLELAKCLALLNGLKRRAGGPTGFGDPAAGITVNDTRVVSLTLMPTAVRPEIITDGRTGQIIEAGGRTLVTASKEQVLTSLAAPEMKEKVDGLIAAEKVNSASEKYQVVPI